MAHIAPVWPNDGDPGWGDTLNANFDTMTNQINTHDDLIASIGAGTAPPPATTTSQGIVQLAGDLSGTATAPVLKAVTTAGTAGSSSSIPVITWDAKGRITAVGTAAAASGGGGVSSGSTTYLSTIGTAAANTTAINNALAAAYTAGGGTVLLAPGSWPHTGLTFPAGGKVELAGSGIDATILQNTTSSTSLNVPGAGAGANPSRPYASGWKLRDLTITTTGGAAAGQVGLNITLAVRFAVNNILVSGHDVNLRFNSVWEAEFRNVFSINAGTTGYHFASGFAGSTPVSFYDCHSLDSPNATSVLIESDANAISWFGGDFVANLNGLSVQNNGARLIAFHSVNFEGNSGTDVIVGTAGGASPGLVLLDSTRHFRGTTKGTDAIYFATGAGLTVVGSYFSNFTNAIHQSNLTAILNWQNITADSVTNRVNTAAGIFSTASGQSVPSGFLTSDPYSGYSTSVGLGVKPGDRTVRTTYGYNLGNSTGVDGDFYIRGDGPSGGRLFVRQSGAWVAVDGGGGANAGPSAFTKTWSGTAATTLTFSVTLPSFTSGVGKVFVFADTFNNGALLTSYEGALFLSAKNNSTDAWGVSLSSVIAPTGFSSSPAVTVSGTGDTRTVSVAFTASSANNAGGTCQVWF